MSQDLTAAERYARAFYRVSLKGGGLEESISGFKFLHNLEKKNKNFFRLIAHPTIGQDERKSFLEKSLAGQVDKLFLNFLKVLISKKRFLLWKEIETFFQKFYEKEKNIRRVELVTLSPLDKTLEEKLEVVLKKKLSGKILFDRKIDETLIGGFILRYEGKEIDLSIRNQLREMSQTLRG